MESGKDKWKEIEEKQKEIEENMKKLKHGTDELLEQSLEGYIKDLIKLQRNYELEWDMPEYILDKIDKSVYISQPIKGELIDAVDVIQNFLYYAVEIHSKALSNAYNVKDAKNMLTSAIELYADLYAVNIMIELINEYMTIPDFIADDFKDLTDKAKSTITLLIKKYMQNNNDKVANEVKSEVTKYYELVTKGKEAFVKDLNNLGSMAKNKEDMKREAYNVLLKVLNLMEKYYYVAIMSAKGALDADQASKALTELVEAYASFSAINALYFMYCEYWDICVEHLENSLHEAFTNTRQGISKIIDYYIKS